MEYQEPITSIKELTNKEIEAVCLPDGRRVYDYALVCQSCKKVYGCDNPYSKRCIKHTRRGGNFKAIRNNRSDHQKRLKELMKSKVKW